MNDSILTRRAMLMRSAQAAACAALAADVAPLFASAESRGFKIGACDWALGKAGKVEAFDIGKEIGLDGIQVTMGTARDDMKLRKPDVQKAFLDAAKRTGLEMASVALSELNSVPLASDPRAAAWLIDSIDVCKALGVKVSMPAFFAGGELHMEKPQEIDRVVKALQDAGAKAAAAGVIIGIENYLSAEDNLKLLDRVGSSAVQVYYDVGNSTDKGRDVCREIRLLDKRICEFHAKDGPHRLGQGRIDFKAVRKAMDDIGFRGWIQLETYSSKGQMADLAADGKFLREIFPRHL